MTDNTTPPTGPDESNVHYLPAHHTDRDESSAIERRESNAIASTGEVLEGEIVTPAAYRTAQKAAAIERYRGYRNDVVVAATWTRRVATHDRTKTTAKFLVRNGIYVMQGAGVLTKRLWEAKTNSRYERQMRSAEVAGDQDLLQEWEQRAEQARQRRHDRRMDWLQSPWDLAKAVAVLGVSVFAVLLVIGLLLAINTGDPARILGPIGAVLDLIEWCAWAVAISWGPFVLAAPWVGLFALWHIGRTKATAPSWVVPASAQEPDARDIVPDEGAILAALRNLSLPALDRKVKEGWQPRWVQATGRDGKGWRTQLELPPGVTVEMILDKKNVLAHNLVRLPVEVWPTEPKRQPGVLDLWVADSGLLTGPVEPFPLLTEGTADYFKGVPVAVDQRGDEVIGRLMASNYAVAGIMGSGKTSLVINLLCGAMLDPLTDLDVFVMAFNADYDPMAPRLRRLVKGDEDEHITAAMDGLRELRSEVSQIGKMLSDLGGEETKVTRALAEKYPELRPRVTVFDECQELFRHDKYGEEAKQLAIKVMMKARKCARTLVWVTPAPSAESLPRDLAKTVSHRVCFAIGDHQGNDAILGTGAHRSGITATALVAGEDIGTAMASGFAARPGLIRTHHIRKGDGVDEVTPIVHRALRLRQDEGITPLAIQAVDHEPERDPLDDIATVLGDAPRMKTTDVLQRLVELHRPTYQDWNARSLTAFLTEHDAAPYKTEGAMQISAARIHEAVTVRNEIERDGTDFDEGDN